MLEGNVLLGVVAAIATIVVAAIAVREFLFPDDKAYRYRQLEEVAEPLVPNGDKDNGVKIANILESLAERGLGMDHISLRYAWLKGAQLEGANFYATQLSHVTLSEANLAGAQLNFARMEYAQMQLANLADARLRSARLNNANLLGADLTRADLRCSWLWNANLTETDLSDADLSGTDLSGVDFQTAKGLTQQQLDRACIKEGGIEPLNLPEPLKWKGQECPTEECTPRE